MTNRTVAEWLALGDDLGVKLAEVLTPGPWKHDWQEGFWNESETMAITLRCRKCELFAKDAERDEPSEYCPVPDPIKLDKVGEALERFRGFSRNELFDGMLDIARPYQPNGEYSNMPIDQMLEIAERYCLYHATAKELWIICAIAKGESDGSKTNQE